VLEPIYGDLGVQRNKEAAIREWLQSKAFHVSGLHPRGIEAKLLAECHGAGDFLQIIMEEVARTRGVDRWIDSTPTNVPHMLRIAQDFPDALFVHIIRDGRDVALSLDKRSWSRPLPWDKKRSLLAAGLYWEWIVRKGRRLGAMLSPRYMEVRYEELVQKPREALAAVGSFLQHDLDYGRIRQTSIGSVNEPLTSFKEDLREGRFTPVGRWKDKFSTNQLVEFERLVGAYLQDLGYPLASDASKRKSSLATKRMRAVYAAYYECKQWAKVHTPLSRWMVNYSEILIDK
ncbi:MAG: sulfotransferase, partial [Candidatus Sulfotelmatobacter sp.]